MLDLSGYKKTENKSYITIERSQLLQIGSALKLSGEKDFTIIPYNDNLDEELKKKFDVDGELNRGYALVILNYSEDDAIEILESALDDEDTIRYRQKVNKKVYESFIKNLNAELNEAN